VFLEQRERPTQGASEKPTRSARGEAHPEIEDELEGRHDDVAGDLAEGQYAT
jgi:hypothetical protein